MSDIGWRADGIRRALAAGGVELEVYRLPGFIGGTGVRRAAEGTRAEGFPVDSDPEPPEWDTGRYEIRSKKPPRPCPH
jgi:hypothetical protein